MAVNVLFLLTKFCHCQLLNTIQLLDELLNTIHEIFEARVSMATIMLHSSDLTKDDFSATEMHNRIICILCRCLSVPVEGCKRNVADCITF